MSEGMYELAKYEIMFNRSPQLPSTLPAADTGPRSRKSVVLLDVPVLRTGAVYRSTAEWCGC
jgi:hypothetical protein